MDNREAVNWLINISADIGKAEHSDLWYYEQALTEIKDMLESTQFEERKESLCKKVRALCEESKIEFFFVGGGESTWSVTNDKHIKKIVECHKAQLSQEDTTKDATSDTISRQAAIEALDVLCQEHRYKIPGKIETYSQYNEAWQGALDRAEGAIFNLPSAQPEQQIPQMRGWVCPVCGRGLSPYTSVCPCNNGKGWEITC